MLSRKIFFYLAVCFVALASACQKVTPLPTVAQQANADEDIIRAYLRDSGITGYTRTNSGLFIKIDSAVPQNPLIRRGQSVAVIYRGYFPTTPQYAFDSNTNAGADRIRVELGVSSVITGWTEGLTYFRLGEKGRLFIPSSLAYGTSGSSSGIPGSQVLIFDMQITNVQ